MTPAERNDANRDYWIVKGHLIPESWQDKDVRSVLDGYFTRIWGNHENVVHEEGFEEVWQARINTNRK